MLKQEVVANSAVEAATKVKAEVDKKKAELQEQLKKLESMKSKQTDALWLRLAQGVETDANVRAFLDKRQPFIKDVRNPWSGNVKHSHPPRKIKEVYKVVNQKQLKAFKCSGGGFSLNTTAARHQHSDTLLFHGCPPDAATNIQAEGLLLKYGGKNGSMLGAGLYGAPDPRKAVTYCHGSLLGDFICVCRFNLSHAKHAGPKTHHNNSVFEEFCVPKEPHAVVLWMVKLA